MPMSEHHALCLSNLLSMLSVAVLPLRLYMQGGPHNDQITALAVALKYAASPEFRKYQQQVLANASALAQSQAWFQAGGCSLLWTRWLAVQQQQHHHI